MFNSPTSPIRQRQKSGVKSLGEQRGLLLVEVLVGILLFSVGVLGLVGLHATSVRESVQAEMRAEASLLADQMLGTMWSGSRSFADLRSTYASPKGTTRLRNAYDTWKDKAAARLPGAAAHPPVVDFVEVTPTAPATVTTTRVTITLSWLAPNEKTSTPHTLTVINEIPQ
jgi:type IV pilus assembly protein PilV